MGSRWLWVLARQNIPMLPTMADDWDQLVESVTAYPFRAPVLARDSAGEHDESRNEVLAHVAEWRSIADAGGEALYARVEPVSEHAASRLADVVYVSPSIVHNFVDEVGNVWPYVIQHVAEVGVPYQQLTQPDQRELVALQMSRLNAGGGDQMAEATKEDVVDAVEDIEAAVDDVEEIAAPAADMAEALAAVLAEIAEIRERIAALSPADDEPAGDPVPETLAMSRAVAARVAAELEIRDRADEIASTRTWAGSREQLVEMCRSRASYDALKKSLPAKATLGAPRTGAQKAKGTGVTMSRGERTVDGEARRLMAADPQLKYSDAARRAAKALHGGQ